MVTKNIMIAEMTIKNVLIFVIFWGFYSPFTIEPIQETPLEVQESMISLMGFLMAAAIIGAFELSYSKTNLASNLQRWLAHFTKLTLYTSIMLLMQIALTTMSLTEGNFIWALVMATTPVAMSLFLYDVWDATRAYEAQATL